MLRLHARNPVLITLASAVIVVAAFTVMSPRFTQRGVPMSIQSSDELERVSVTRSVMMKQAAPKPFVQPQIAKTASIELIVADVDRAASDITGLAHEAHGDVFALQASGASDGHGSENADATIRIPESAVDATMQRLAALGTVRSRTVKAEDLTGSITDSSARLRNLERTEADILKIMDRSGNVAQIMDVENQLSSVREQIETLQSDVALMRGRVTYSTIDITLQAEAKNAPAEPNALSQLKNAFAAATHSVADATVSLLAVMIWLLVWIPYLALFAAALWAVRLGLRKYAVRR